MQSNKMTIFFVLSLTVCLTQFASDIYAPSVVAIATSLQVSVNIVQLSMAVYLVGVAVSQLFYGPISEGVGRKYPLLVGLILMLVGSALAVFSPNMSLLMLARVLQGFGAGACSSLWRSVFRDLFVGDDLAKFGSYLSIIIMFIVSVAPALGGYLQYYFGWRASFVFMLAYALLTFILLFCFFKETSSHHKSEYLSLQYIGGTYYALLRDRLFMGITLVSFLSYGALFAMLTTLPVLLIHELHVTPVTFGWMTSLGFGSSYGLAGWLNGRYVKYLGMSTLLRLGLRLMLTAALLLLISWSMLGMTVIGIMLPLLLFNFASTFIWPNAFALAFTPFGHIAGYTGALYGFFQVSGAVILAALMSYLPKQDPVALAMVIMICSLAAWQVFAKLNL